MSVKFLLGFFRVLVLVRVLPLMCCFFSKVLVVQFFSVLGSTVTILLKTQLIPFDVEWFNVRRFGGIILKVVQELLLVGFGGNGGQRG